MRKETEQHLCQSCEHNGFCDIQDRNKDIKQMIACVKYEEVCSMSPECSCEDCKKENVKMD